jgi:hypothetical protein
MIRKVPVVIALIVVVLIALAILAPGGRKTDTQPKLPWQVEALTDGGLRVFGLTLEHSTLAHAQQLLSEQPVLSLFRSPDGHYAVEAYFKRASLSGLRADFIFSLSIDQQRAEQLFGRGLRISQLGSGSKKVELTQADVASLMDQPLRDITYIPQADLSAELIRRQFGEPAQQLPSAEGVEHWLYPNKGLDIALNPDGKEVFQYTLPGRFNQVVDPLLEAQ